MQNNHALLGIKRTSKFVLKGNDTEVDSFVGPCTIGGEMLRSEQFILLKDTRQKVSPVYFKMQVQLGSQVVLKP
jgi:hypothetical protein